MKIERRFTKADQDTYADLEFTLTSSEIRNPDGTIVFKLDDVEIPVGWSQVASDVLAQKYFRKAGVAAILKPVKERGVPSFLWRQVPDQVALADLPEEDRVGGETSAKQVFRRLAGAWAYWGWKGGYFTTEDDARAYFDEMQLMLARQQPAMVQHRPALGLWHRRTGAGPPLCRSQIRQADEVDLVLRTPAAPRLFHPVGQR